MGAGKRGAGVMGQEVEAKLVEFPAGVDVARLQMEVRRFEFERGAKVVGIQAAGRDVVRLRWMVILAGMELQITEEAGVRAGCVVLVGG